MRKTQPQIVESIYIASDGGQYLDEATVPSETLEAKVDEGRAIIVKQKWEKNRIVHPLWLQKYYPEYVDEVQDEICCTTFYCPGFVYFGRYADGLQYAGSSDFPENFSRVWDRTTLATLNKHPVMKQGRRVYAMTEGEQLKLFSKKRIPNPMAEGVYASPVQIPTYNKAKDFYPLDPDSVELLEKFVREYFMRLATTTPQDTKSDSLPYNPVLRR